MQIQDAKNQRRILSRRHLQKIAGRGECSSRRKHVVENNAACATRKQGLDARLHAQRILAVLLFVVDVKTGIGHLARFAQHDERHLQFRRNHRTQKESASVRRRHVIGLVVFIANLRHKEIDNLFDQERVVEQRANVDKVDAFLGEILQDGHCSPKLGLHLRIHGWRVFFLVCLGRSLYRGHFTYDTLPRQIRG